MRDIDGIEEAIEILDPHWPHLKAEFDRTNDRFKALFAADHEAIGRVLRAHLVIENFIDGYLRDALKINDLPDLRLSFAQKAKLLPKDGASVSFVRPGILQVNKVRNKLGHDIEHVVELHHVSAIAAVLEIARPEALPNDPISMIEQFAPVACAFLAVLPADLGEVMKGAFAKVRTYDPEGT